ncbi:hypothetical protein P1S61_17295 [Streptomyces sp. ME08-AFT2]|uniref:hypothetical protein n=1 Tax=Streptomyces sp. ME08-AFT2 TaxID=3028683 RepID=UPI0029BF346B|nr:hypothetical protein [Streptomyces sp. ME08-AFT2]MDX3310792.1 hypothetical protein [Streptomyces sp. ME08-AFT2]
MTDHLSLVTDEPASNGWRFSVIPPKQVWTTWYHRAKTIRRPAGSLALPATATTATLHFTHAMHDSDSLMALALTTLVVSYDAVVTVCRTWQKTAARQPHATHHVTHHSTDHQAA